MRRLRWCGVFAVIVAAGCAESQRWYEGLPPGEELIGFMSEGELDRLVSETSAALREAPAVARTDRPLRVAPPAWVNATDLPVARPAEFLDRYAELINSRVGGGIQFLRAARPTDATDTSPPGTTSAGEMQSPSPRGIPERADLVSRLLLQPGKDTDRDATLRLELSPLAGGRPIFDHASAVSLKQGVIRKARENETRRQESLADSQSRRWMLKDPRGEVVFARSDFGRYMAISERQVTAQDDGGLTLRFRVRAKRSLRLATQVTFLDRDGQQVEVSRPQLRSVSKGKRIEFTIRSQLPAERYLLHFDRY